MKFLKREGAREEERERERERERDKRRCLRLTWGQENTGAKCVEGMTEPA